MPLPMITTSAVSVMARTKVRRKQMKVKTTHRVWARGPSCLSIRENYCFSVGVTIECAPPELGESRANSRSRPSAEQTNLLEQSEWTRKSIRSVEVTIEADEFTLQAAADTLNA